MKIILYFVTFSYSASSNQNFIFSLKLLIVLFAYRFSASLALAVFIDCQNAYAFGARGAQTAAPWSSLENNNTVESGENADGFNLTMVSNPYFGLNAIRDY